MDQIYVQDDFLSDAEIEEWLGLRIGYEELEDKPHVLRKKLYIPDDHPLKQALYDKIATMFIQPWFVELIEPFPDHSWRCVYNRSPGCMEVGLSRYAPGGKGYIWHIDHADGLRRILNFIIPLNDVSSGGELQWNTEPLPWASQLVENAGTYQPKTYKTIPHKKGQISIIPSHYPHRVMPSEDMRISLHGHVNL